MKRQILVFTAILLIGFFTACEQQEVLNGVSLTEQKAPETLPKTDQNPLITSAEGELETRQQLTMAPGWNYIDDVSTWRLQNGTTTVTLSGATGNLYFGSIGRPDWSYIYSMSGWVNAYSTKTYTYDSSTPLGGKQYVGVWFYNPGGYITCNVNISFNENTTSNPGLFPAGFVIGLESGDVINGNHGNNIMYDKVSNNKDRYQYLQESGAKFVRINFFKPGNHNGSDYGWLSAYDQVVNELTNRNIPIYAVVTGVVGGDFPATGDYWSQRNWIDTYATTFRHITDRYNGKITHYESFNEPNNWVAFQTPAMPYDDYAYLLQQTWNKVKAGGNPNNITLISGPVLAHDMGANPLCGGSIYNNGPCYLQRAIEHTGGTAYFDAVGYHIYVAQGGGNIPYSVQQSADIVKNMLESKGIYKDIYISEIGWDTQRVGGNQATYIEQGLNTLRNLKNTHRIKGVSLFGLADFVTPNKREEFGLVAPDYMHNGNGYEKPALQTFKNLNKGN